jgi:hypothetical protein
LAHDAFISYPSADKLSADAACATLEAAGIRCWIAPRDISPGIDWSEAIVDAIDHSSVMVLVFSSNSNASPEVAREIHRAVRSGVTIMPLRIERVEPTGTLAYYMSGVHWLDALTPPLEQHLQRLAVSIRAQLQAAPTSRRNEPVQTQPGPEPPTVGEPPTAISARPTFRSGEQGQAQDEQLLKNRQRSQQTEEQRGLRDEGQHRRLEAARTSETKMDADQKSEAKEQLWWRRWFSPKRAP